MPGTVVNIENPVVNQTHYFQGGECGCHGGSKGRGVGGEGSMTGEPGHMAGTHGGEELRLCSDTAGALKVVQAGKHCAICVASVFTFF